MSEKLIINQVSIRRKGLDPKIYSLPLITDILTDGSVKSNHIDWTSVASYLDNQYVTKTSHQADIDRVIGLIPDLQIDELTLNLKYNNLYFLNVNNCPEDLSEDISDLNTAIGGILDDIEEINTAISNLEDKDTDKFLELKDVTKDNGYIAITDSDNSTKYLELLTNKLISLSAIAGTGGTVYVTPKVEKGGKALLIAEPDNGYKFVKWTLNAQEVSTNAIHILNNIQETALYQGYFIENSDVPPVTNYQLTISKPSGGDIIAKINGTGDNLGYNNVISLALGTQITLLALASTGYNFTLWTNGVPQLLRTLAETSISLNSDTTIEASFAKRLYSVTIGAAKDTNNTVIEGNYYPTVKINDVTKTEHSFNVDHGTTISLDADTPILNNYYFKHWSDATDNTNEQREVEITNTFSTYPIYEYRASETIYIEFGERINGSWHIFDTSLVAVKLNGNVIANPYNAGQLVNINKSELTVDNYQFVQWEDEDHEVIELEVLHKNVSDGTKYYGVFVKTFNITVTSNNTSYGTVNGSGTYALNSTVTITATPKPHYHFVSWNDGNTTQSREVTVSTNATYTATFAIDTYTVSASVDPTGSGTVKVGGTANSKSINHGSTTTLVATPSSGYLFVNWTLNGTQVATTASYTTPAITAATSYVAHFAEVDNTIYYFASENDDYSPTGKTVKTLGDTNTTEQLNDVDTLVFLVPTTITITKIKDAQMGTDFFNKFQTHAVTYNSKEYTAYYYTDPDAYINGRFIVRL